MNLWHIFARRLRRSLAKPLTPARNTKTRRHPDRCRPAVLQLEDRTVPSATDMFADATVLTGVLASAGDRQRAALGRNA